MFQYIIKAGFFQYLLNFLVCTDKKRIAAQQILHIAFPLKGLYEQWMHFYNWGLRCEQGLGLLPGRNGHTAMPIDMDTIPRCCLLDCFLDDGNRGDGITGECVVADSGASHNIFRFQAAIEQYPPEE